MTGEEWVVQYCRDNRLDWAQLSFEDQRALTRMIPCTVRCWRIGGPVEATDGQPCPECGRPYKAPLTWPERLAKGITP